MHDSTFSFNDDVPSGREEFNEMTGKTFYSVYGPVFKRNSRFSEKKPVPQLGDKDTPAEGAWGFNGKLKIEKVENASSFCINRCMGVAPTPFHPTFEIASLYRVVDVSTLLLPGLRFAMSRNLELNSSLSVSVKLVFWNARFNFFIQRRRTLWTRRI